MFFCKYWEISKKAIFKNICVRLLLKRFQEVIDQDFRSGESLSKIFRLSNITKMSFAFKLEPSLNLIPTLYFGLKFPILIINGYDKKANACSPWTSCSPSLLLVTLQAFSGISRNSEQKIILQTTKQLIQFRVLEIQFRPLKYISAIRIRKKFEQHPIPIQAIATRPEQC